MFYLFLKPNDLPRFGVELAHFEQALHCARQVHPQMSVTALLTLVTIGHFQVEIWSDSLSLLDLAKRIGIPYNSFIRNTDLLGEGSKTIKGLGLIQKRGEVSNKKERRVVLTEAGVQLLRDIENALKPLTDEDDVVLKKLSDQDSRSE